MGKHVAIIVNPVAGKQEDILWSINKVCQKTDLTWDVLVTKQKGDAYRFAKEAAAKNTQIVAVYGGDGTVAQAAQALIHTKTTLAIIPGGTANVFANELKIPINSEEALKLIVRKQIKKKTIDAAKMGNDFVVLRIEAGLAAHMVQGTKRTSKRILGQMSYLLHGASKMKDQKTYTFSLDIDGEHIVTSGIALTLANIGNIGIKGYSMLPQITCDDGLLDVVILKKMTPVSAASWFINTISRKKSHDEILSWKAKKVVLTFPSEQTIICDDSPMRKKKITVEVLPKALDVIVP